MIKCCSLTEIATVELQVATSFPKYHVSQSNRCTWNLSQVTMTTFRATSLKFAMFLICLERPPECSLAICRWCDICIFNVRNKDVVVVGCKLDYKVF